MSDERLSLSLQESILTTIVFSENAKVGSILGLLTADLFDNDYREIAKRALEYRTVYKVAPGKSHVDDILDDILESKKDPVKAETHQRILVGMLKQEKNLNVEFVCNRVLEFIRRQTLKQAVLQSAQRYQQGGDGLIEDVEGILYNALRVRPDSFDPGIFLSDRTRAYKFLEKEGDNSSEMMRLGIPYLDKRGICPTRKELLLWVAARGKGKSWALIHTGAKAMQQNWNVVHISLEMDEDRCLQRYFQQLHGIAKRSEDYYVSNLELDEFNKLSKLVSEKTTSRLNLQDPNIRKFLMDKHTRAGHRLDRVIIKQFPTRGLTIKRLEAYLDNLEIEFKFIPDLVIIDYLDIMHIDESNHRLSTGRLYEDFRGLLVERNIAGVSASQGNRESEEASEVKGRHIAEDISKLGTVDIAITYSQTIQERILSLARLYVEKARNDDSKFSILISQDYKTGQFIRKSCYMEPMYWDILKATPPPVVEGDKSDK